MLKLTINYLEMKTGMVDQTEGHARASGDSRISAMEVLRRAKRAI